MESIYEYVENIILLSGGSKRDVDRVVKKIKEKGYTTIEEVDSFLDNVYI